ncbi:MAG: DcaP family trimeric outer membrane transporter [bacterium]
MTIHSITKRAIQTGLIWTLAAGVLISPGWSETTEEILGKMQQQIGSLQEKLIELEKRNVELEQRLMEQEQSTANQLQAISEKTSSAVSAEKPAIRSKYPVDLYGYLRMDAAYDTARTDEGNYALWVRSEEDNKNDSQFNMTARQSRFGLTFDGPKFAGAETSGKIEVDFYEGGSENKNRLMMRHGFMQLDWPDSDFSILAGQTSDVISPLVAPTLNYTVGWWVGDIGYRRPQLRFSKGYDVSEDTSLLFQLAAARTIGDSGPFSPGDTGEDAGFPSLQGRTAFSFPFLTDKMTTVGVSGHWGEEEYDFDNSDHNENIDTWSLNLDLSVPLLDWLSFQGTLFTGENLDAYLGGIAQGIVVTSNDAGAIKRVVNANNFAGTFLDAEGIESSGGWAALSLGPFDDWRFNFGASIDNPEDDDLPAGARARNAAIFGNALYNLNEAVEWGLELSYWDTEYKTLEDGDSMRIQTSLSYKF